MRKRVVRLLDLTLVEQPCVQVTTSEQGRLPASILIPEHKYALSLEGVRMFRRYFQWTGQTKLDLDELPGRPPWWDFGR